MFEQRLKIMLIVLAMPLTIILARLAQLQIVDADVHRREAEDMLYQKPKFFPFLRGQIVDRHGTPLAWNAETWELGVHYMAMAEVMDDSPRGPRREWEREFPGALVDVIDESWREIAELTRVPSDELRERADERVYRIRRIKEHVAAAHGLEEMEVWEEYQYWPIVRGLDFDQQVDARIRFAKYPWIEIVPSQQRRYKGGESIGPILGRLGEVPQNVAERSREEDDLLGRYQPGDLMGISGCEALGESWLRGRRGFEHLDKEGKPIRDIHEAAEPVNGRNMRLSLDLTLQQRVYNRLAAAVAQHQPYSTGASAVILHVPTREVRAMVSYPSYDPNLSWGDMLDLESDTLHRPLSFRALGGHYYYPPGSVVKPMVLAAGIGARRCGPATRYTCHHRMFVDYPDVWGCEGYHGEIGPLAAVQKSCNVFFYHLGQDLGVDVLRYWMGHFGFGAETGTGLPEERSAHLPRKRNRGTARLAAIGQGELDVTPIQVANMMADLASGYHQKTRLWMDDPMPRTTQEIPVPDHAWTEVRKAMYMVVNEPGGTAYTNLEALRDRIRPLTLLGKTGSAEGPGHVVTRLYTCVFEDGRVERLAARSKRDLRERYPGIQEIRGSRVYRRFPPPHEEPTHAWFAGYLTDAKDYRSHVRSGDTSYAIACVIEFSGHGGDVAAPVVGDIILDLLHLQESDSASAVAAKGEESP